MNSALKSRKWLGKRGNLNLYPQYIINMILILLSIPVIFFAFLAVHFKDLIFSVVFLAVVSISLALIFLVLQAPDIAITEAAVNAGFVTLIYVIAIKKTRRHEE
jgi:energy-converting hydrogenase B subunit D